jgi:hypothetical protein
LETVDGLVHRAISVATRGAAGFADKLSQVCCRKLGLAPDVVLALTTTAEAGGARDHLLTLFGFDRWFG